MESLRGVGDSTQQGSRGSEGRVSQGSNPARLQRAQVKEKHLLGRNTEQLSCLLYIYYACIVTDFRMFAKLKKL